MRDFVHLLIKTTGASFGGETLTCQLDCAVLILTPELLNLIKRRCQFLREIYNIDNKALQLYFWHCNPLFYEQELIDLFEEYEGLDGPDMDRFDNYNYTVIPTHLVNRINVFQAERTECDQMALRCSPMPHGDPTFSVCWYVIPKHSGLYVETESIEITDLEELLK